MKTSNIIYGIVLVGLMLSFTGCGTKIPEPRIITITEEVEVKVETKPKRPIIKCEFSGEGAIPNAKLLDCLAKHKRVIESITVE